MSVRGGRSLRRQIEAALSGEADPLGEDGLGPSGPSAAGRRRRRTSSRPSDEEPAEPIRRGKRGRERHVDAEVRAAYAGRPGRQGRRAAKPTRRLRDPGRPRTPGGCRTCASCRRSSTPAARSRAAGRGSGRRARRSASAAGTRPLAAVPHGAKTFLAAALGRWRRRGPARRPASGSAGSPATPRSATAWPRSCRPGSAIPTAVAVLEPRTALAYERSELVRDETAARVAALAAWRSGPCPRPRRQRPGAPPAHPRPGRSCRPSRAACAWAPVSTRTRCSASCSPSATTRSSRSPAAASSPGAAASWTSSRPPRRCPSGSSCSATRSTRCAPSIRPTSAASGPSRKWSCCPPASSWSRRRQWPRSGARRPAARRSRALPERLAADLARFEEGVRAGTGRAGRAFGPRPRRRRGRPRPRDRRRGRGLGRRPVPRDRPGPPAAGTLLVLDEPGDIADAADFLWRQAAGAPRASWSPAGELPERVAGGVPRARATGRRASCAAGPWS